MLMKSSVLLAALCAHVALARLPERRHAAARHGAATPYRFEYAVNDPHTHDVKRQRETSDGRGRVQGSYSLLESDGSTRLVEYTADAEHGFNARVKKIEASAGLRGGQHEGLHVGGLHVDSPHAGQRGGQHVGGQHGRLQSGLHGSPQGGVHGDLHGGLFGDLHGGDEDCGGCSRNGWRPIPRPRNY